MTNNDLRCYICDMLIKINTSNENEESKLKQLDLIKQFVEASIKKIKEDKSS
jgi:hypothetical protein